MDLSGLMMIHDDLWWCLYLQSIFEQIFWSDLYLICSDLPSAYLFHRSESIWIISSHMCLHLVSEFSMHSSTWRCIGNKATGWFIGIPLMDYYNPQYIEGSNSISTTYNHHWCCSEHLCKSEICLLPRWKFSQDSWPEEWFQRNIAPSQAFFSIFKHRWTSPTTYFWPIKPMKWVQVFNSSAAAPGSTVACSFSELSYAVASRLEIGDRLFFWSHMQWEGLTYI